MYCNDIVDLIVQLMVPLLHEVVALDQLLQLAELRLWERVVAIAAPLSFVDLPDSPIVGIPSSTWLLGNLLWISERVEGKTPLLVRNEAQLLAKLLQTVPPETYAANGVAVSWTKVSESHSVPVVYPEALNDQLQILLRDRYVRTICNSLIWFNSECLRHPLSSVHPTPMYPTAPTLAEQYGFGDIASESSFAGSFSATWKKMKSIGKASWARNLLEKAGLRRKHRNEFDDSSNAKRLSLTNTSASARKLAASGATSDSKPSAMLVANSLEKVALGGEPFALENIKAFSLLWATFLFRWGRQHNKIQPHDV
uniref:Uncharacterized protein n=1 Tax=Globisporangium ultimum (strain ATCC 200006 / CBS 805.95 / DAOM BR144) TaxID=431595 RepID=K3X757_GLOUD